MMLGNAGQQFDGDADRPPQPLRAQLGQEERDQQPERHGDQHRDERGYQSAVDRRKAPNFSVTGFQRSSNRKLKPKAWNAGKEPLISAEMTPPSSTSTKIAAARVKK